MYQLSSRLLSLGKTTTRVKLSVEKYFNYNYENIIQYEQDLSTRREILLICYLILKDFPNEFLKIFTNTNVRLTDMKRDIDYLPYWFEKEVIKIR